MDYIVVGCGLAGISFCEQLKANGKTFVVFDDGSQLSSVVAGGLYNPVVLKRFTSVWKSQEQLQLALPMYSRLEKEHNIILDHKVPILRRFNSLEEQNNWFIASDKPNLNEFLSTKLVNIKNQSINAPFGFGRVLLTGRIDTHLLVASYKRKLLGDRLLIEEKFTYPNLNVTSDAFKYGKITSNHVVFAEGFGGRKNPFFNHLPLNHSKGELITIYAPKLKLDFILKSNIFLIPLGDDIYRVGATYNRDDQTNTITKKGKEELLNKLKAVVSCSFEVVDQVAGIRPTVIDRRPLVGGHPKIKNMFILNGLGTRGVMIGPYVAQKLFDFIEYNSTLDPEIDIKRFAL